MISATTYTKAGVKTANSTKLDDNVYGIKDINHKLLNQAYDAYNANGRVNLASTKTRGMVSGGGKKPWRQKGTGRARVGSSRTPVWRGGGIVFGPTGNENYAKKLNIKSKRTAIRHALSAAAAEKNIFVLEELSLKTSKTKELSSIINKISDQGYTLLVTDSIDQNTLLASQNLPNVKVIQATYLNVVRIMDADNIIITKQALKVVDNWLKPNSLIKERQS